MTHLVGLVQKDVFETKPFGWWFVKQKGGIFVFVVM